MIKIVTNEQTLEFNTADHAENDKLANAAVKTLAVKSKLNYQRMVFSRSGKMISMDYLTYENGEIRDTYNVED